MKPDPSESKVVKVLDRLLQVWFGTSRPIVYDPDDLQPKLPGLMAVGMDEDTLHDLRSRFSPFFDRIGTRMRPIMAVAGSILALGGLFWFWSAGARANFWRRNPVAAAPKAPDMSAIVDRLEKGFKVPEMRAGLADTDGGSASYAPPAVSWSTPQTWVGTHYSPNSFATLGCVPAAPGSRIAPIPIGTPGGYRGAGRGMASFEVYDDGLAPYLDQYGTPLPSGGSQYPYAPEPAQDHGSQGPKIMASNRGG